MSKRILLAAALIAVATNVASAQNVSRINAGAALTGIAPRGALHTNVERAFGVTAYGSYRLDANGRIAIRVDGSWLNHGWDDGNVQLRSPLGGLADVDLMTSNDILFLEAGPEVSASVGRVQPYAGARAGIAYFVTAATATRSQSNLRIDTNVEQHDGVFAYGAHAGVRIPIATAKRLMIDVGAEYHNSDEASYIPKGSVAVDEEGRMSMTTARARANFWGFHVGVSKAIR